MTGKWTLVVGEYEGLIKKGVNLVSGEISGRLRYVLTVRRASELTELEKKENNLVMIGRTSETLIKACVEKGVLDIPQTEQGYSVYVGKSIFNAEREMIAIGGFDEAGTLYGCVDFCNKYCGSIAHKTENYGLMEDRFFKETFHANLYPWQTSVAPVIAHRALWTWGHVIYDYRSYFENMLKLRLNEVVIWNDGVPLNAKDVVAYAHSLGIKVFWGYAWGWDTGFGSKFTDISDKALQIIKENVLHIYETQYVNAGGDGIYFQSFTETSKKKIGERNIAETVMKFVNDVAGMLLEKYPDLDLQFGLHAISVKDDLRFLEKVDTRVRIVWEDCGAFPFHYNPDKIENFDETVSFTERLLRLRGQKERFGAVLKGMLNLDWVTFEHWQGEYILGERTRDYIENRQRKRDKIWKIIQGGWLKQAKYVQEMLLTIKEGKDLVVEALVEDGMFENKIAFPVALYAELAFDPNGDVYEKIGEIAKYPCVHFAND